MRAAIIILFIIPFCSAAQLTGRVVSVHDGDTFTLLAKNNRQVRVRLAGIDAPELGQPYGKAARQAVSSIIAAQYIKVDSTGSDRYGRVLGVVHLTNGTTLNYHLVRTGMAWQYLQYDRSILLQKAQQHAQIERAGLWADRQPTPPWVWRKH